MSCTYCASTAATQETIFRIASFASDDSANAPASDTDKVMQPSTMAGASSVTVTVVVVRLVQVDVVVMELSVQLELVVVVDDVTVTLNVKVVHVIVVDVVVVRSMIGIVVARLSCNDEIAKAVTARGTYSRARMKRYQSPAQHSTAP